MKMLLLITVAVTLNCAPAWAQDPSASGAKTTNQPGEPGDVAPKEGTDAQSPDADARRVEVTVTDGKIEMATELEPGKTAFVVTNKGSTRQTFEVRGGGGDRRFVNPAAPGETKVLNAELKSGVTYTIYSVKTEGDQPTKEITLHVK